LRKIHTCFLPANALYLEIFRLVCHLVTAFQRNCLDPGWQSLTLQKLRFKLFLLPSEITRPRNRPALWRKDSQLIQKTSPQILAKTGRLKLLRA